MKLLTKQEIILVAEKLNIEPAILNAVILVESAGSGFYLGEGKFKNQIKVLFEPHIFHRFTNGRYDKTHPTLSYPKWSRKGYLSGQASFGRFMEAIALDKKAAQLSTSYGLFQIMGFNWEKCGFSSVVDMITEFYKGEINQLIGFVGYCENTFSKKYQKNLIVLLQEYSETKNVLLIKEFVLKYNGSGQVESYTAKILDNIKKYK